MKLSEWKLKHDKSYPNGTVRSITMRELLDIEFDNQPDSSKREDGINIDEWHKRNAFGSYADAVLGTRR